MHVTAGMDRDDDGIEVTSQIEIEAAPDAVWRVLVDFADYEKWNPFIRRAGGRAEVGKEVRVRVQPSLPIPLRLRAKVTVSEHALELRWFGHTIAPWVGAGDHVFQLERLGPSRTRFTQREVFTGVLPRIFRRLLLRETKRGFDAMNEALAQRARAGSASVRGMHAAPS